MAEASDELKPGLVIDNGSFMCKAGFCGDEEPMVAFPSIIGRPKYDRRMANLKTWDTYVGEIAQRKRAILNLKYPVERGVVTDWDDMEKVWHHALSDELHVSPEEHPVFLTDSPLNPRTNREIMAQMWFEKFNVRGFQVCFQAILSMFASGRNCGVVLDSGDGVTQVLGLTEGHYSIGSAVRRLDLAGVDLTKYLTQLLLERGYNLTSPSYYDIVRDIKEKLCYTAQDFDQELAIARNSPQFDHNYELPDGQVITIGAERFRCAEALFQPSLIGLEYEGVHKLMFDSLMSCDVDLRSDLMVNFIISGGSTMFPGFETRLQNELILLAPESRRVRVVAQPYRKHSAWIGASILGSLSSFEDVWITKAEYEEHGPGIVHRRCN